MNTAESIHIAVALMMQCVSCFNALISKRHTSLTSIGVIVILARKKRHNHKNKIENNRDGDTIDKLFVLGCSPCFMCLRESLGNYGVGVFPRGLDLGNMMGEFWFQLFCPPEI